MRVYISVDMEGIAGINTSKPTERGDDAYPRSAALMGGEANAAIEGAFDAGAEEVVVNDSHGKMYNLPPEELDPRARLVQGTKAWSMVEAAAEGRFDVALFVGYHARAGHPRGTLAHTYTGGPTLTTLAGRPTGEYGINAMYLGTLGVPVGMVAGDDALAEEVADWLPWAERVVVKVADGGHSAASVHPSVAAELVRGGAERAVRRAAAGDLRTLQVGPPVGVEIDFSRGVVADHAAIVPGAQRIGDRTVRFEADDPLVAFRGFLAMNRLAGAVDG